MARKNNVKPGRGKAVQDAPFPALKPERISKLLTGRDTFRTWAGFYGNPKGLVDVVVYPPEEIEQDIDAAAKVPPQPAQAAAYQYLKEHEAEVTAVVVRSILREYPKLRRLIGAEDEDYPHDEFPMPPVKTPDELKLLFGPIRFYVLAYAKDGVAYIGMAMDCTWDPEHRLGVMTHKSRILEIGQEDVSFARDAARKDRGKALTLR